MSNRWDPDQAQHFVGLELDPNCLHRLSNDTSKQIKPLKIIVFFFLLRVLFKKNLNYVRFSDSTTCMKYSKTCLK